MIKCFLLKLILFIFVPIDNLKFSNVLAKPILACIIPNRRPMHTLGPAANTKDE